MIFKKIYTFLNDRWSGNFLSKFFLALIFIITSCVFFFVTESNAVVVSTPASIAKSKADRDFAKASAAAGNAVNTPPTISYISSSTTPPTGNNINEFHILYQKTGLNPVKIYTSYLPPKNSYNNILVDEHTLEHCGVLGQQGADMIGKSCMVKIPFDCSSPPTGVTALSGENCLNYSAIFPGSTSESKKLNPRECEKTGETEFTNCISSQKPYCHTVPQNPIIGINCKLAPCNEIPNQKYRRPGVNCLADCNDTSNNAISKDKFFIEGFTCLTSCKTKAAPKNIGENCVLEFNDYVMPLCNQQSPATKNFNKSTSPSGARGSCLDVIDLPLCSASSAASDELTKCVKECSPTLNKHNINCINFLSANSVTYNGYVDKKCHHYTDLSTLNANASCTKLDCHKLSDIELSRTLNVFDLTFDGFSTGKYCNPTKYTNFSLDQFRALNTLPNAYLRDYKLDNKPCYSDGDTEEIETVLSSNFYKKPSVSYSSKIEYLKSQCTGLSYAGTATNPLNCTSNSLDRTHDDYNANFLYDQNSFCTYGDISQQILCVNYKRETPAVAPNDCNSPSLNSCPAGNCPICQAGETYCFKNGINCNSSLNQKYPICSALKTLSQPVKPSGDEYVSWFFRPTIDSDAIRELTSAGGVKSYSLINMSGYPTNTVAGGTPSDDLYMSNDDLRNNGYIDGFWGTVSGSYILGNGTNMGLGAVGAENICGMNNDFRNIPTEDFAYFRGGVTTVYGLDDKVSHNVEICIRYRSSTNLMGTCGYRRCYTSCVGFLSGLSPTCSKVCGYDVCKTMSIEEESNGSQTDDCSSTSQNFSRGMFATKNGRTTRMSCSATYNTASDISSANTRVRIYKPSGSSNYICAVLDFKGITLDLNRNGQYFNGSEYFLIPDPNKINSFKKLCVSGIYSESTDTCESGVNTNNQWTESSVWRTARIIKYIMQPSDVDGKWNHDTPNSGVNYLDQYGVGPANLMSSHVDNNSGATVNQTIGRIRYNVKRYFEKSDCIRHESKIGAPIFFSVADISNSHRLFLPSLEIEGSCEIASSPDADVNCTPASEAGTDFFKPAIKILYGKKGATNSFLSVDPGSAINTNYKLLKITNPESEVSEDYYIKALNIGITTSATIAKTVFIKKEKKDDDQPKLCLYEKISLGGNPPTFKESLIKCVNRKRAQNVSINPTSADPLHTHLSFGVKFLKNNATLLSSISDANLHSSIIDANLPIKSFTFETLIDLKNKNLLKECEQITGSGFPICVEREECSILNNECVENEKALIIAKSSANPQYGIIAEREVVSNYCKTVLLTKCNFKKGFDLTSSNTTLNTSILDGEGFNAPAVRNHYGWFNEFCITSGIEVLDDENKYKYVEALIPTNADGNINEEVGKCKTMTNPSDCQSCDNTICLRSSCCKIYNPATSQLDSTVKMRKATPRELGLCYTITNYLKTCPAISFGKNDDTTDTFFVGSSFLGSLLSDPHSSHVMRFNSVVTKDGVNYNSYNAEYDVAYGGVSSVMGKCVGFYKNRISQNNPTANCAIDGTWNSFSNSCALYTCPAKKLDLPANGANFYGNYISSYDTSNAEIKSQAGSNEGYANWNFFTKTGYLKERATSALCITGYAKKNSTPVVSDINQVDTSSTSLATKLNAFKTTRYSREINALYKKISSFSGGIDPSRLCNQLGIWESVSNSCERITCPALNFEKPVDYNAFYMNDYDLAKSGDVLYCATYSGVSSINKVKVDTGSFSANYLNVVADSTNILGSAVNNLSIKNSAGVTQTLLSNRTYVLEKIPASGGSPAYWKILDNSNDAVLRALWIKSGGATFGKGYALRSISHNYEVDSALDPLDKHRVIGTCNAEMGFNPIGANLNPELLCDSNGNWDLLKNQCTSDCSAVNGSNSLSRGHGFANWIASKAKVGTSEIVSATQCSNGYLVYPYPPLYDNEGVKGDFGVGAAVSSSGEAFSTADVFDGIASTTDGANFVATPNAGVTLSPTIGSSYNFKISNLLNAGFQSSGSNVQTSFYLFNNSSLTLNAPTGSIWSKINFSSFGTPDYTNSNNLIETPSCHSEYSKFILGTKCIGKSTCSISLSDFLNYDNLLSTPCITPKYGNGTNGEQNNSNNNFGSGGGGGGGNNPGSGGTSTSSTLINGMSGTSYYDKAFHLTPPTLSEGTNKGLKVDLTSADSGQFNGGKGSVQIEESTNNGSSYSITGNYQVAGEYNHTISSGATNQDIYVRYIMIGGGGGGGGAGLTKGTDGANGTKMTGGVFVVKKGTILKIHVGGGGEAGKTRCRSAGGAFLDPRYINPAIEILEPEKETNFVVKALRGIGSLIVSEGWAQVTCSSSESIKTTYFYQYCEINSWSCIQPYKCYSEPDSRGYCFNTDVSTTSSRKEYSCVATSCSLNGGYGYVARSVSGSSTSINCDSGYSGTVSYTCRANPVICHKRLVIADYRLNWSTTCSENIINATSSNCVLNRCKLNAGTGYDGIANVSGANNPITCKAGYQASSPAPTYTCTINDVNSFATVSGSCIKQCTIPNGNGYAGATLLKGDSSSSTCSGTGYDTTDTATYSCANDNTGTYSITSDCNCASGYGKNGSGECVKQCTIPAGYGYAAATILKGTTSSQNCSGTGYDTTDTATYSCPNDNTGAYSITSDCNCASGYAKNGSGACVAITCTSSGESVGTSNTNLPIGTTGTLTCVSPYSGSATYSCAVNNAVSPIPTAGIFSITTPCPNCVSDYAKNVSGECVRRCTISGVGYSADGPGASSYTGIGSGSFTCFTGFAGTINYTCTGPTSATLGSTGGKTDSCTKISCTANSEIAGIQTNTVIAYSSVEQHIYCNDPLYNNFLTASFPACTSATGLYSVAGKNNCKKITCAIPADKNVTTDSIDATASTSASATSVSLTCKAGYYKSSASLTASCNTVNAERPQDKLMVPNSGSLNFTGTCAGITCTLARSAVSSATDGSSYKYLAQSNLTYTGASPDKTFACNAGYVGNVTYNCNTATNGQPATHKSDTCKRIKCRIGDSAISGAVDGNSKKYLARTDLDYTGPGVFKTFPCNAGYVGNVSYKCDFTTDGEFATEITDNCVRIKCTIGDSAISGAVDGNSKKYLARTDLDYTGASPAKTFSCNEGYYGDVTYTCNYTTNGQPATAISDNCRRIKCDLPASANSNLTLVAGLRTVDYSAINKQYTCGEGFEQAGSYAPTYTCVGNAEQTNPATVNVSNACTRIQCLLDGTTYDFGQSTIACPTELGLYGNKIFNCNTDHSITYSQRCNYVSCRIPNSGASLQNSSIDGDTVLFTGASIVALDCKNGYYYSTRPQYTCSYDDSVGEANNYGRLNLYGKSCERITCNLPTSGNYVLNSILDNDPLDNNPSGVVNWTGSAFISTTCKEGFYMSDPTNPPKYSCDGTSQPGLITTNNSCSPVTCDIADRVGMFAKNNLEYGVNKTTSCNKPGYSGLVTYTCGGAVSSAGKGTLSGVSSTCKESSCDRAQNNAQTYDSSVGTSDQVGGAGGKILAASTFLKGGNGGSASNVSGVTSGSGGGGGSASMISINNRIIAIAGGGGGGAGGGITENTSSAYTKSNNYDLEQTLLSNVFGPYLIAEMQYSGINGSNANTAGVLYQRNSGSTFSINAPPGMFINDIFLASSGDPTIDFSVSANLILKHGSCNNLQGLEEMNKCLGKESCSFTVDQSLSCAGITPNFGVVASYYFQEPTLSLKINPPSGSVLINSPVKNITQFDSLNRNFIAANNIRNDVVYTFSLLKNETWAKFNYLSDQYYIAENPPSNDIRVRFHRENTTLLPQLKIGNTSLEIKKDTGSSLTMGYIKINTDYILRKKVIDGVNYWTIRPYISTNASPLSALQREKPKRTCMTNLFSAGGGVNVIWSQPNSYCINSCPSFADDNRIGVGATQHTLSSGVTAIAKWGAGTLGQYTIQRFTGTTVPNSSEDGGGLEFSKTEDAFDISVFKSDDTSNKFILARLCNADGTWSNPISLCEITNSTTSKTPPIVGATSYINSQTSTGSVGNNFMEANSSDTATSSCSDGYGPEFTGDIFKLGDPVFSTFKYKCVIPAGGKVDKAYFEKVPDPDRRDCIKSCVVQEYFKTSGAKPSSISYGTKADYKIKNATEIQLECESRYLPAKINGTRPTDGRKPTVTCSTSASWNGTITNPCTLADRCNVTNEGSVARAGSNNTWFPLSNFINETHRTNGMNHGLDLKVTYAPDATQQAKKYGKCGYCRDLSWINTFIFGSYPEKYYYRRKYLKSYYCNDGAWVVEWENNDTDYDRACDGDHWDHYLQVGQSWEWGGNEHPSNKYLGDCISNNTSKYSTNLPDQN